MTRKINFITSILHRFFTYLDNQVYVEIGRNESCYCKSGKKFKYCHFDSLENKGKIALWKIDRETGNRKVEIYSKRKFKGLTIRLKTTLRGVDVKATDIALNDYDEKPY